MYALPLPPSPFKTTPQPPTARFSSPVHPAQRTSNNPTSPSAHSFQSPGAQNSTHTMSASANQIQQVDDESLLFHQPANASITDPSTADGSHVVFDRELPLEVRHSDDQDSNLGTLLSIKVKVLVLYKENNVPESVRVELSRESDLFFHMYHSLQDKGFASMQARQKLMVEFQDYPHMLVTNFNKCIKDPHNCMAVLYIHRDGSGRMDFIQNMEFKFVELLSVDFLLTPSDVIKQHIIYRYFTMKNQVEILQTRLQDVNELIKSKSPSLLLAIKKTPLRLGAQGPNAAATNQAAIQATKPKSPLQLQGGVGFNASAKRLK